MDNYDKRKQAILRHLSGEKVSQIVRSYGKSRQWFYTWLNRYETSGGRDDWYKDESKAPKIKPTKVSGDIEQQVVAAREQLQVQRYAQTGAIAIQYELNRQGIEPPPAWTINRILARKGLNQKSGYHKSTKEYPEVFISTHQMDLVGPRYIKGDGRYYSVNIIDTSCHSCSAVPVRTKSSIEIAGVLAAFWSSHGMPDAIQMDNELAFRGSNRYPRSFGVVVRFALALNIAPVFIPIMEPWRNGMIEKFNNTHDKRFVRVQTFDDFEHLIRESKRFTDFHNANHRYSSQQHKTPNEMRALQCPPICYDNSIDIEERIPLETGSIYFIRFIRSDLLLKLPTESFKVKESLKYSYVVAEINIDNHCLVVRQNNEVVQMFNYPMPVDW